MTLIKKIISKISPWHCNKCGSMLNVLRDHNGTYFGYGLWYCPKCEGDIKGIYYGKQGKN